ncbi:electron transport complex subunit RsxG [Sulfurivirga sp.]|uniref:electron transport complex subunit RsxG n=1 Tax=Sulfurivirga sp. TaxID=2614236 RepID=UPI0025F031E5|nr:electron transport complex subunit RsxG [Sulfurivirga sp.]
MNRELLQHLIRASGRMALFIGIAVAILVGVRQWVEPKIEAAHQAELLASLTELLPPDSYDNDLLHDTSTITAPNLLGTGKPVTLYRARKQGKPVAVLFEAVAPEGYSGPIRLLIGIRADGHLLGVRVLEHRETPGLGDKIEKSKTDWVDSFVGRQLTPTNESQWAVKKDGGMFDQFTGATITPRAVVKAVKKALIFFNRNREKLWN